MDQANPWPWYCKRNSLSNEGIFMILLPQYYFPWLIYPATHTGKGKKLSRSVFYLVYDLRTQNMNFVAHIPEQVGTTIMHFSEVSGGTYFNMAFWRLHRNALQWFSVVLAWVQPT